MRKGFRPSLDELRGSGHDEAIEQKFEKFWGSYPRSLKREEAYEAYRDIALDAVASSDEIMKGLALYKQNLPDPKYIPAAAKWLREKRWREFSNLGRIREKGRMAI